MKTLPCVVVDGPKFHDIMNSFGGSRLGDAFPVTFTLRIRGEYLTVVGKVVGVGLKDPDCELLMDLKVQCIGRLSNFNPVTLTDLQFEVYRPNDRKGQGRVTESAFRHICSQ